MKNSKILTFFYIFIVVGLISCLISFYPSYTSLKAASVSSEDQLVNLQKQIQALNSKVDTLNDSLTTYGKSMNELEKRLSDLERQNAVLENYFTEYYIDKLKDPEFVVIYNDDAPPYYIAAENLGQIGKPAIPLLISRLDTRDDYERSLVLYALLLASQADNVKPICENDYIHTSLDFDARNHPKQVKLALDWWEKYKTHF